jgi:hypothetical protein
MFVHCSKCLSFSFTQFVQFVLMPTPSSVYIRSKRIFNSHPSSEILNEIKKLSLEEPKTFVCAVPSDPIETSRPQSTRASSEQKTRFLSSKDEPIVIVV